MLNILMTAVLACILFSMNLFTQASNSQTALLPQKSYSAAPAPATMQTSMPFPQLNFKEMQPFPQVSEAEVKEMLKLLETLPPEELEALAKIGEAVMEEAKDQGFDAREIFGLPQDDDLQRIIESTIAEEPAPEAKPELPAPKEPVTPQPTTNVPEVNVKNIKAVIKNILFAIDSIKQKALIDRSLRATLDEYSFMLTDLNYYLNVLLEEKITKLLFSKEFDSLPPLLRQIEQKLVAIDMQFELPESYYEGINPYTILGLAPQSSWEKTTLAYQGLLIEKDPRKLKKELEKKGVSQEEVQKRLKIARADYEEIEEAYAIILERERALQAFELFLATIHDMINTQKIVDAIKKIMTVYEPEALKTKQLKEQREAQARKEQEEAQRRRPPFTPIVFEPTPQSPRDVESKTPRPSPSLPFTPRPSGKDKDMEIKPTMPSGQKEQGGDKKKEKDKDTSSEKSKKDKEIKEEDKQKKEVKLDPKLSKKLETVEKELRTIDYYIETEKLKKEFEGFAGFLSAPMTKPYDASNDDVRKTKILRDAFIEINKRLVEINKELWDVKNSFVKDQQKLFSQEVKNILLKRYDFQTNMKDVLKLYSKDDQLFDSNNNAVPLTPEKSYIFLGKDIPGIDTEPFKVIKELNKDASNSLGKLYQEFKKLRGYLS